MKGHIRQRSKGSWTIWVDLGRDPETGKRKQQTMTVRGSKKDAERELRAVLTRIEGGAYVKPAKQTVGEYLNQWLQDYAKQSLSPRGFERYQGIIHRHLTPAFGKIQLTQLKPENLQKHYAEVLNRGLNPKTVRYHHAVIHVALQTAVKWGLVSRNIADAVEPPSRRFEQSQMQIWNEAELNCFLDTAKDSYYYALFYTALFTGMRRSELLALCWQDIDFIYGQIYVSRSLHHLKDGSYIFTQPKSKKSCRTIALPPSAFLVLSEHRKSKEAEALLLGKILADSDLVFSTLEGQPLRPNTVTRAWMNLSAKAGVKVIRLHDARHTHASLMLKQGIHPKIVQERLGHSSITMTLDIYSHITPGLQEAAARRFDDMVKKPDKEAVESIG
ncbi:putative prophage phiRv2 integrase [subsurface metagenome]